MAKRFIFVGNRRFVLQEMLRAGLDMAAVVAVKDTHLARDLEKGAVAGVKSYSVVSNKQELLDLLAVSAFDVLLSNGCPYILPISKLPKATYANIHPSCLPDLRGVDPVIGAILHARDAGATCHVMDDGIDTGAIISQVRIPFTEDLDVTTLYQLSFAAEQRAFRQALARDFAPRAAQVARANDISYKRSAPDMRISFDEPNQLILRKIKAFNNRSQGCEFTANGVSHKVFSASLMSNPFLLELMEKIAPGRVAFSYENCVIFRKDGEVIRFLEIVSPAGQSLSVGDQLF